MRIKITKIFFVLVFVAISIIVKAQDSTNVNHRSANEIPDTITVKESSEMLYKAEVLVREFNDLLNVISSAQTDIKETKDIISNSFADSKNKIFNTPTILLEDDVDPNIHTTDSSHEVPISKYLNDFDLLYHKSDSITVRFSNIKITNIKKGDYLYAKAYFTSSFTNKNANSNTPYVTNNRVAEIRFDKLDGKWKPSIIRVGFFNAADTVNEVTNNVFIKTEGANLTFDEQLWEKEKQKQIDEYNQEQAKYNALIAAGDSAVKIKDYTAALKNYTDATEKKPYDYYPKAKLNDVRKLIEQETRSSDEVYQQSVAKASLAMKNRQYETAKDLYTIAVQKKPEKSAELEPIIRDLTNKIRTLTELNEKYISGLYDDAIKDYDRVIKKDNTNSDYYLGRGKCYDKKDNASRALKDYSQSIDLDNSNLEALNLRARLYEKMKDNFKALTDYKIYIGIDKTNPDVYMRMAAVHILTNNISGAYDDLNSAIALFPRNSTLYYKKT